ncbi:hypothetical protein ACH4PU_22840 [Streptomyces sp. NPDC021100]|uniref:hypothetical protein n=1 Tax=Streptomyces sp. NPDC021100 TaxID=3365114 RepID=UPI00379BFD56
MAHRTRPRRHPPRVVTPKTSGAATRFGGFLLVLAGLVFGVFGGGISGHASGLLGTRGTFTVERCERLPSSHRGAEDSFRCSGSFRPRDGGRTRTGFDIDREYEPGRRVNASCGLFSTCYKIDRVNACGWFSGLLVALLVLCLGGPMMTHGTAWQTEPYARARTVQWRLAKGLFCAALGFFVVFLVLRLAR